MAPTRWTNWTFKGFVDRGFGPIAAFEDPLALPGDKEVVLNIPNLMTRIANLDRGGRECKASAEALVAAWHNFDEARLQEYRQLCPWWARSLGIARRWLHGRPEDD